MSGHALAVLSGVRLNLSPDARDRLAREMQHCREMVAFGRWVSAQELSKGELVRKAEQLQRALSKAKRLYMEINLCEWGSDDIPEIQVSETMLESITFTRDSEAEMVKYGTRVDDLEAAGVWGVQILQSLEGWATDVADHVRTQPAQNYGTWVQWGLKEIASHCREAGIKISPSENGQFYKIAAFVSPGNADLSYRIKKLIDEGG